jgi:hypothetical protein
MPFPRCMTEGTYENDGHRSAIVHLKSRAPVDIVLGVIRVVKVARCALRQERKSQCLHGGRDRRLLTWNMVHDLVLKNSKSHLC